MGSKYPQIQEPARRAACMWLEPEIARPFSPSHAHVMHETVQREIEKQRIKEEILVSDIVRRRVLEAEVRQELMMERKLASQRSGMVFPMLGTVGEWRCVEERILLSLAQKERLRRGGFEALPFQRHFDDVVGISDVRPAVPQGAKEKKRFFLQVKPDEDVAGSKRKASTPRLDSSKSVSNNIISSKKAKAEWFCSLCHVSATSEQGLKEHLKGKKHKSKEVTLRAKSAGKLIEACASESPVPLLLLNSDEVVPKKDDPEKDETVVPEKEESKKDRFKFWCEMCRVGAHSKEVWKFHNMGKKHTKMINKRMLA